MKRLASLFAALCCVALLSLPAQAQDKLFVAAEGAKLKTDKLASADTVAELPMGTELKVLKSEDSWYRVKAGVGEGWIYRGKVAATPPEAAKQGGDNLFGGGVASSITVSEADSARSVRGLNEDDAAKTGGRPRSAAELKQALDRVLAEKVAKKELESFLKSGRIGEYAK